MRYDRKNGDKPMKTAYISGNIYTGDGFKEAFLVEDGYFLSVGNNEDILKEGADEIIDLHHSFVCPGFNDSHMHLLNLGKTLLSPRLDEHSSSLKELLVCIKETLSTQSFSGWYTGRGWNQDLFSDERRMPEKNDLDEISKDIPIFITRVCGHCAVANSKALEIAGIDEKTMDPPGGAIGRSEGIPNGILFDNAIELVSSFIPLPDKETLKKMIGTAAVLLNSYGVTSVQSDDYCVYRELPFEAFDEACKELEEEGRLNVRLYEQANFTDVDQLRDYIAKGNKTGKGSGLFKKGPLKLLGDGSLGARSAHLSVPYHDDPSTCGFSLFTQEEFDELIETAVGNDMQVAVHAIGDACLDRVLNAYEKALKKYPKEDHRNGIVHCQISRPDQLEKIASLHLHVYAQSVLLDYDNHIVLDRAGEELASSSYAWKTLMKKDVHVSNGSDAPVELPDVFKGIECAVTRTSLDGTGPYRPEEAFSLKEALDSFTKEGAYSSFEEGKKGLIKEGYLADFLILDEDPFEASPEELHTLKVKKTFLSGREVYTKKDPSGS